jgi:creatinine amidohydrolase
MLVEVMTWQEYDGGIGDRIIVPPVGLLEQHGSHLPLAVGSIIAAGSARLIMARLDALVLPLIAYGCKSQPATRGRQDFPGTTSIGGHLFTSLYSRSSMRHTDTAAHDS